MHDTAYEIGRLFFETYGRSGQVIVELGSWNVNGSLRDFCPSGATYLGLDVENGPSVDIRVDPGRPIPLRDEFADLVVSSSAFEHDPCFWETFLELARVLKPGGFLYLNAPSNGTFHRYPSDCWRFYPDAGRAFESLARKHGHSFELIECFTAERRRDVWNDFVAIFAKGPDVDVAKIRFLSDTIACRNVTRAGVDEMLASVEPTEDMRVIRKLIEENSGLKAALLHDAARVTQEAMFRAALTKQIAEKDAVIATLTERLATLEARRHRKVVT